MAEDAGPSTTDGATLGRELSTAVVLFHDAVARRLGLSVVEYKALDLIARKGPFTAGMLARETGLTPGAVTGLVDRLERAGYLQRRSDPADRRRKVVSAVVDQHPELATVFTAFSQDMSSVLGTYGEREKTVIADYLVRTIGVLTEHTRAMGNRGDDAELS